MADWEHCGDLIGLEECALLLLNAERFAGIVKSFMEARTMAALYARNFVVCLNRFGHSFTDVIDHKTLFDYEEAFDQPPPVLEKARSSLFMSHLSSSISHYSSTMSS